jgi:alpha-L-fucosidase 2
MFRHSVLLCERVKPIVPSAIVLIAVLVCATLCRADPDNNERLWFDYAAEHWNSQALHIGNGFLGGSFYGGVEEERIDVAEKSLWMGGPGENSAYNYGIRPGGKDHVKAIRDAVVAGDVATSDRLAGQHFTGDYRGFGAFSMVGDLRLLFGGHDGECTEYVRELDLSQSLARVSYKVGDQEYRREYFCSYPDRVMVLRLTCSTPGVLNFALRHDLTQTESTAEAKGNELQIHGVINGNRRKYCVGIRVLNEGGEVAAEEAQLVVKGADAVTILYAAATEYVPQPPTYGGGNPDGLVQEWLDEATEKGCEELRKRHVADYRRLYGRVRLTMAGDAELEKLPTNRRWETLADGNVDDTGLKVLLFNLGRYLIISASRPGTLPSNLQGVWNTHPTAPWSGNYQSNINLQEMYWPCGPVGLLDCQEAYIDWIGGLVEPGRMVAQAYYGTEGWVSHTTGNIWGYAAPGAGINWGLYPVGAAWHCQHVWEQYAFSMDEDYLRATGYPVMKEATQFWLANLVPYEGSLISAPTVSAEHGVQQKDGKYQDPTVGADAGRPKDGSTIRYTIPGAYQDIAMIHDLFSHVIEAAEILDVDQEFREKVAQTQKKLLPLKIGKYGQLQEWALDLDSPRDHHRHIAHLYAVHPATMIHPRTTPDLAEAAKTSLNMRRDGYCGAKWPYTGGNWARTWRVWCWARLLDGERAAKVFNEMVAEQGFENLMTCQQTPRERRLQVDGSMSTPGFMAEMLLQSHMGEIHLLPALPAEWPEGSVRGLRARGGFLVDMDWEHGKLRHAVVRSTVGGPCKVRYGGKVLNFATEPGSTRELPLK